AHFTLSFSIVPRQPYSTLFPYTTLFRSDDCDDVRLRTFQAQVRCRRAGELGIDFREEVRADGEWCQRGLARAGRIVLRALADHRSEEHTSELQSRGHLVCRLLLEKKKQR